MGTQTFDAREQASWKSFLDSVVAMGYRLAITEFDVSEIGTPADIPTRDRGMADLTRRYLDAMLRYPELEYVMCWGLVDRFSWLQSRAPRADGLPKRPAPYDGDYQPKLIRQAMADAFRAAPMRG
jgi:endo-1,4-beta-xylanase